MSDVRRVSGRDTCRRTCQVEQNATSLIWRGGYTLLQRSPILNLNIYRSQSLLLAYDQRYNLSYNVAPSLVGLRKEQLHKGIHTISSYSVCIIWIYKYTVYPLGSKTVSTKCPLHVTAEFVQECTQGMCHTCVHYQTAAFSCYRSCSQISAYWTI